MKFSIVTPTYNRAYTLPNLIRSVLNQNYQNWELLIVDDGSTDSTQAMVSNFSDCRIKYFYQENRGPSAARNLALRKCIGDWIIYIDSDNELLSNYLDVLKISYGKEPQSLFAITKGVRTLELFHQNNLVDIIDDSNNYPNQVSIEDVYIRKVKFDINGFAHSKRILEEGYKWNEENKLMEDWDFFMSFADKYPESLLYISIPLFHYHQRFGIDGLVSNATYEDWAQAFEYIYHRHKNSPFMNKQSWYPERVEKYKRMAAEFNNGTKRPAYLKYFPEFSFSDHN